MQTEEKFGHLSIMLLSGITLCLISGAARSLGVHYDAIEASKGIIDATGVPGIILGCVGLIGLLICMFPDNNI